MVGAGVGALGLPLVEKASSDQYSQPVVGRPCLSYGGASYLAGRGGSITTHVPDPGNELVIVLIFILE